MDRISPARPAEVSTTGINLKIASINTVYIESDTIATSPGSLYQRIKNIAIIKNPHSPASTLALSALSPSEAPMVCVPIRFIGTGNVIQAIAAQ